jgi:S-adenosylmethionine:tRNA ribosyltransferase-isomerase
MTTIASSPSRSLHRHEDGIPLTVQRTGMGTAAKPVDFVLPPELEATVPAEVRGNGRDDVRLLASWKSDLRIEHHRFTDLPNLLEPGDLVVVNTSGTLPAAVTATLPDGSEAPLHFSTRTPEGLWLVEIRPPGRGAPGMVVSLPETARVTLLVARGRLWLADVELPAGTTLEQYLDRHGRPIRYSYVTTQWPLSAYQTVYATEPGSAEMPSAGRAITPRTITDLVARGVGVAPLLLHCGVSSLESHEPPYPEHYRVPADTARRVNATRRWGGRVVAIGTTVVRALESVVDDRGRVHPGQGWTDVMITPERGVRVVDGLLTGWHEPEATHLLMLEAVAGRPLIEASYAAALDARYLWHEFGDTHLILP